jgi:DNA polymerase III subunit delta
VKISGGRVEAFLKSPDRAVRAVLVYGPDTGLARERVDRLVRGVVTDPRDPFRVAELSPARLKEDPARLADEAAAMALTGGRRVVVIRDAGDAVTEVTTAFLANPKGDALVVLEGGDLGPRSSLRKLFEGSDAGAAIGCYADDGGSLAAVIHEELKANNLSADADAIAFLVDHLGGDRRLTRAEMTKLVVYMGTERRVTLADAIACVGDSAALSLDDLALATADGDHATAQRVLDRLLHEGAQPVSVLRSLARHFLRLHLASGVLAQGRSIDQAMAALKPPVMFKTVDRFKRQLNRWPADRLGKALELLLDAEGDCKTTGMPAAEITSRAIIQLARAAGRR